MSIKHLLIERDGDREKERRVVHEQKDGMDRKREKSSQSKKVITDNYGQERRKHGFTDGLEGTTTASALLWPAAG